MKHLKTIFGNALILSTIVTVLAGTVLFSYSDPNPQVDPRAPGLVMKADEGVPHNMVTADASKSGSKFNRQADEGVPHNMVTADAGRRGATRTREHDEGTPAGMIATLSIPSGSIIDAM